MDDPQTDIDSSQPTVTPLRFTLNWLGRQLMRIGVVVATVLTIWVLVGSSLYPGWWYAAIWKTDLLNGQYRAYGWSYLLDNVRWLLFCITAIAASAAMYFYFKQSRLIAIVDRIATPTFIVCVALLIFDALFLYRPRYEFEASVAEWASGILTPSMLEGVLASKPSQHQIVAPVDFHYIDSARINGVYSEIEPDLVETERTISSSKKQGGSAELGTGSASLKGETSKEKQETEKYERSDASAERKCIQIINFTLNKGFAHYYTSINDFYALQMILDGTDAGRIAGEKAAKEFDPSMYAPIGRIDESPTKPTPEQRLAAEKQIAVWNQKFRQEAQGFVVVSGAFHVTRIGGNIVFEEEFSARPQHIIFRFTLPAKFDSDVFRDGSRMRLFGDMVQGTDDLRVLTVHPLAIFNE